MAASKTNAASVLSMTRSELDALSDLTSHQRRVALTWLRRYYASIFHPDRTRNPDFPLADVNNAIDALSNTFSKCYSEAQPCEEPSGGGYNQPSKDKEGLTIMDVKLQLAGYKCRITHILARMANPPFSNEEDLLVEVEFSEPYPAAIITTVISIPVKDYTKEEFLEVVQKNGDEQIAASIERHHQQDDKRAKEEQRQAELDAIAHGIEDKFGLRSRSKK